MHHIIKQAVKKFSATVSKFDAIAIPNVVLTLPVYTCSKSAMGTPEHCVKSAQSYQ